MCCVVAGVAVGFNVAAYITWLLTCYSCNNYNEKLLFVTSVAGNLLKKHLFLEGC